MQSAASVRKISSSVTSLIRVGCSSLSRLRAVSTRETPIRTRRTHLHGIALLGTVIHGTVLHGTASTREFLICRESRTWSLIASLVVVSCLIQARHATAFVPNGSSCLMVQPGFFAVKSSGRKTRVREYPMPHQAPPANGSESIDAVLLSS